MPIYPVKCKCGFAGDVFAKVAEMDAEGRLLCPECGERAEQDYGSKSVGMVGDELRGTRRESVEHGCQPHEVPALRQMYGNAGKCWQDDGSVKFADKSEAKSFFSAEREVRKRMKDKKAK